MHSFTHRNTHSHFHTLFKKTFSFFNIGLVMNHWIGFYFHLRTKLIDEMKIKNHFIYIIFQFIQWHLTNQVKTLKQDKYMQRGQTETGG